MKGHRLGWGLMVLILTLAIAPAADARHYKISCVGDSITENAYPAKLAKMLELYIPGEHTFSVLDHGIGGQKIHAIRDMMLGGGWLWWNPDFVLIMAGTNNVLHGYYDDPSLESMSGATLAEMQQLVNDAKAGCSGKIIVAAIPPTQDRGMNEWTHYVNLRFSRELRNVDVFVADNWNDLYDEQAGVANSDYMRDRLHPNLMGNWIVALNWFEAVRAMIQSDESSGIK